MKQISLFALLFAFAFTTVVAPAPALADYDDDDDKYEYYDKDEDDDDANDDDSDDDDWRDGFEVEATVYTDVTIVKVEKYGKKTTYETDADTRDEVIAFVNAKYGVGKDDIDDALEFEVEDRASRTNERAKISNKNNRPVWVCTDNDDDDELEVEADVFTDTTIVKVELENGKTYVYESDATTSAAIIDEVADKYDLDEDDVEAALDFEVEDRASNDDDFDAPSSSDDDEDCEKKEVKNSNNMSGDRDAEIKARIAQLEKLIETLIQLLNLRLSLGN